MVFILFCVCVFTVGAIIVSVPGKVENALLSDLKYVCSRKLPAQHLSRFPSLQTLYKLLRDSSSRRH